MFCYAKIRFNLQVIFNCSSNHKIYMHKNLWMKSFEWKFPFRWCFQCVETIINVCSMRKENYSCIWMAVKYHVYSLTFFIFQVISAICFLLSLTWTLAYVSDSRWNIFYFKRVIFLVLEVTNCVFNKSISFLLLLLKVTKFRKN